MLRSTGWASESLFTFIRLYRKSLFAVAKLRRTTIDQDITGPAENMGSEDLSLLTDYGRPERK